MHNESSVRWTLKCAVAAAVILGVCVAAKPFLPSWMQAPAITARDGALVALNRYVSEPIPEAVLLGSSLTARIREDYFDGLDVRNLAIGGGSPLTGLRFLLLDSQRLPRTILVESNLLSKEADERLIESFSRARTNPLFRPVRMAVAAYENWQHAQRKRNASNAAANRLLAAPAVEYNNQIYLARAAKAFDQDVTAALESNIDELALLVSAARSGGARVLLFELPYADLLEHGQLVRETRQFASDRFGNSQDWLHLTLAKSELRWPDGMHMDERSAVMVARAIEQALNGLSNASEVGLNK